MLALIDADSMVYTIAHNNREHKDVDRVKSNCDEFLSATLGVLNTSRYLGVFSAKYNFRYIIYKYALYKGQRPEKSEYYAFWEPIIKDYYRERWGFIEAPELEADDVMAMMAEHYKSIIGGTIICSPDKDLKQIPGYHFNYLKPSEPVVLVSADEAYRHFCLQLMMGDASDNIKGLPKIGEKKARDFLKEIEHFELEAENRIKQEYIGAFGVYYGPTIYDETYSTVKLVDSTHPKIVEAISTTSDSSISTKSIYLAMIDMFNQKIQHFDLTNISGQASEAERIFGA